MLFGDVKNVLAMCVLVLMLCVSCGSSETNDTDHEVNVSARSCDLPDTIREPQIDVMGSWWVEILPHNGEDEDGFVWYYSKNNNVIEGFFTDQDGENHYFSGMVSGYEIQWSFKQGGALKITLDGDSFDGKTVLGDYCDCRDGTSGTMAFSFAMSLTDEE